MHRVYVYVNDREVVFVMNKTMTEAQRDELDRMWNFQAMLASTISEICQSGQLSPDMLEKVGKQVEAARAEFHMASKDPNAQMH